jgi:flagellar motor protein MotB
MNSANPNSNDARGSGDPANGKGPEGLFEVGSAHPMQNTKQVLIQIAKKIKNSLIEP